MNEIVTITIMNYLDEHLFEPRRSWPKTEFNRRSYSRWAVEEILELLINDPLTDPFIIISHFEDRMIHYSLLSKTKECRYIFEIAVDVCEDILSFI